MPIDANFFRVGPTCETCGLYKDAVQKCMASRGSLEATYVFISDTPERKDVKNGKLWSDRKLDWVLEHAGIREDECYFTSLIKCSVPNPDTISDVHISSCLYYLLQELAAVKPKVIFVTGKLAFTTLTKTNLRGGLGTARGASYPVNMPWGECHVVPTWKLSFADFKVSASNDVVADLLSGKAHVHGARKTNYRWVNTPEELIDTVDMIVDYHRNKKLQYGVVAVDSETTNRVKKGWTLASYLPANNIGTVQVSWADGEAIAVPVIRQDSVFNNPINIKIFVEQFGRILQEVPVVGQNYKYDELYFRNKLGLTTRFFMFDTMLAHHFLYCGSMPNDLGFMVSRHLGWRSHKRDIDEALEAMPEEVRAYGWLPKDIVTNYGCGDTDGTLQLYPVLREKMRSENYSRFRDSTVVVYDNMLTAFIERTMTPWRAFVDMEIAGAKIDTEIIPEVTEELSSAMADAFNRVASTPPYAVWILDHTKPNPKRRKYKKKSVYKIVCSRCNSETPTESGKRTARCPVCNNEKATVKRNMVNTEEFTENFDEPETITDHLNFNSPQQVSKFFYDQRYLGLPILPKIETSTNKVARAEHVARCEKADKHVHVQVLLALGDYSKASKLYSAYATKLGDYLMVNEKTGYQSGEVTSPFEQNTGVNHIHTTYKQNGTYSGRMCFSENTRILTDQGGLLVADLLNDVSKCYHAYTHKGNWKRISHVFYKGREQLYRIETRDGVIECTREHRIWLGEWVRAGDLIDSFRQHSQTGHRNCYTASELHSSVRGWGGMENVGISAPCMVRLGSLLGNQDPPCSGTDKDSSWPSIGESQNGEHVWGEQKAVLNHPEREIVAEAGSLRRKQLQHRIYAGCSGVYGEEQYEEVQPQSKHRQATESCTHEYSHVGTGGSLVPRSVRRLPDYLLLGQAAYGANTVFYSPESSFDDCNSGQHREVSYPDQRGSTTGGILVHQYLRSDVFRSSGARGDVLLQERVIRFSMGGLPGGGSTLRGTRRRLPLNGSRQEIGPIKGVKDGAPAYSCKHKYGHDRHGRVDCASEAGFVLNVTDLGEQDVWDICVEDDHSFYAQGMFHHNSTSTPSFHVIPRASRIKSLFISRFGEDGLIGQADLSQAEVRGFVIETGDESLREAFVRGEDPYIKAAAEVLRLETVTDEIRQDFKSVILGMLYGRGATAISEQTKRSVDYIKGVIAQFFNTKPKLPRWMNSRKDLAHKHRCAITRFGRIRPLIDELSVDDFGMINHAENVSINHPIQGMVGDLGIDSTARIHYRLRRGGFRSLIFNTVHDSTIVDIYIPELLDVLQVVWEELYSKLPVYFPWINVPFTIDMDIGPSWGEKAGLKMNGRTLTLSAVPDTIQRVLGRLKNHFNCSIGDNMSFDPAKGKLKLEVTI